MSIAAIIDPKSLSFESIKQDLINYVQSRPDYAKWQDFYEGGAGTTQLELFAGVATFLSFHAIGARRETYIETRKLRSSAINICTTLG